MSTKDLWDKSVDAYHVYAEQRDSQYWQSSRKLIELAQVASGQIVVDLAAGTGVTTKCLLEMVPEVSQIHAVDLSQQMLNKAKEYVQDERVTYICGGAEDVSSVVPTPVDRVICNSAFWQFPDRAGALAAIQGVLKSGGIFAFNLPNHFVDVGGPSHRSLFVVEMYKEMELRGFGQKRKLAPKLARDALVGELSLQDLHLVHEELVEFPGMRAQDSADFFSIPAVAPFFEGVSDDVRDEILASVVRKLAQYDNERPTNKWIFFITQK